MCCFFLEIFFFLLLIHEKVFICDLCLADDVVSISLNDPDSLLVCLELRLSHYLFLLLYKLTIFFISLVDSSSNFQNRKEYYREQKRKCNWNSVLQTIR